MYPMAVVGTASRGLAIYQLEGQPKEFQKIESPLKYQVRLIKIFFCRLVISLLSLKYFLPLQNIFLNQ